MTSRRTKQTAARAHGLIDERATSEGLLLALLGQQAMRRLHAAHTKHKLSPRQFHLLGLLHDRGALTQRELGTLMDVDPSILVTLLNPLESDGYLSRERDATDRRRHVVTLTRRGHQQLERAAQAQRDAEDELFAGLTDAQREQLRGILLVLREQLAPGTPAPAHLPTRQRATESSARRHDRVRPAVRPWRYLETERHWCAAESRRKRRQTALRGDPLLTRDSAQTTRHAGLQLF